MLSARLHWLPWYPAVLLALFAVSTALADDTSIASEQAEIEAEIARLIDQLGHESFATREQAQAELARMGLLAFDALHVAQSHEDVEIARRARFLVRSLRIGWIRDEDSRKVKEILRGYDEADADDRRSRMDHLSLLGDFKGTEALCRLVRFETGEVLSKEAALTVMQQEPPSDAGRRRELSATIRRTAGFSKRTAATWLRAYAETLVDPASAAPQWNKITRAERQVLDEHPEQSNRLIVRDLLLWQTEMLYGSNDREEADVVARKVMTFIEQGPKVGPGRPRALHPKNEEVVHLVDWLVERQRWSMVVEASDRFEDVFAKNSPLLYRLAEAQENLGQHHAAQQTVDKALKSNPDDPALHVIAGLFTQQRGKMDWAEKEFRLVIEGEKPGSTHALRARLLLSELYHDRGREKEAADMLEPVVQLMQSDEEVADTIQRIGREPASVISRMHFFRGEQLASAGKTGEAADQYEMAIKAEATDADVLISMYRLPGATQEFRAKTLKYIDEAANTFKERIARLKEIRQRSIQIGESEQRDAADYYLGTAHNQLAWLIGNTTGPFDEAVEHSQKSLALRPDTGGFLDTLAHCYFSQGNFEKAVEVQRRAVELEPHSGLILEALDRFETALEQQQDKDGS